MCGFAGVINGSRQLSEDQIKVIASHVSYRGPDSSGFRILNEDLNPVQVGNTAIFFNRLAILDLDSRSNQPFENDQYLLVFNGEIYNFKELKAELQQAGVLFHTTSDTEVLFHCLRIFWTKALPKLNGMFSFFFMDKKERKFLLSRDRLGIKPLYYSQKDGGFYFGSELKSIVRLNGGSFGLSRESIEMYLWLQYVPTPYTILENIFKLPPANFMEGTIDQLKQGVKLTPRAYWDAYDVANQEMTADPNDLEEILRDSLQRQLVADVPLGLFLSSGVDSSTLASLVNKYFSKDQAINFFTVGFDESTTRDESTEAREFINGFNNPNLHNHVLVVNSSFIGSKLDSLYKYYDEPFADSASLLNWVISEKAKEYVTVAISGDGADELFWGYPRYEQWKRFSYWSSSLLFPGVIKSSARLLPNCRFRHNVIFAVEPDPVQRHFNLFLPSGMRFMIDNPISKYSMWATEDIEKNYDRADLPSILDIKMYLADAMLYKVDRSSMAASLEVRVPYLDNQVVDFALRLPFTFKSNARFKHKAVLKELLSRLAPHYNLNLVKRGFGFPLQNWMKNQWKDQILSLSTKAKFIELGLEPEPFVRLISYFYEKNSRFYTDVWYLFNLSLWLEQFKKECRDSALKIL